MPVWSPWLLVIAASIVLVLMISRVSGELSERAEAPQRAEELLRSPSGGYRLVRMERDRAVPLERLFQRDGGPELRDFEVRQVVRGNRVEGAVVAALAERGSGDLDGVERGFSKRGGQGRQEAIGAARFFVGEAPGGWVAARLEGPSVIMVFAPSREAVRRLAEPYGRG